MLARAASSLAHVQDRRELRRVHDGSVTSVGSAYTVEQLDRHREVAAVAVEDAAALRGAAGSCARVWIDDELLVPVAARTPGAARPRTASTPKHDDHEHAAHAEAARGMRGAARARARRAGAAGRGRRVRGRAPRVRALRAIAAALRARRSRESTAFGLAGDGRPVRTRPRTACSTVTRDACTMPSSPRPRSTVGADDSVATSRAAGRTAAARSCVRASSLSSWNADCAANTWNATSVNIDAAETRRRRAPDVQRRRAQHAVGRFGATRRRGGAHRRRDSGGRRPGVGAAGAVRVRRERSRFAARCVRTQAALSGHERYAQAESGRRSTARRRTLSARRLAATSSARGRSGRRVSKRTRGLRCGSGIASFGERGRGAGVGPLRERLLHHAVFERVVREHEHAALGPEHVHRLVEPVGEVRQLAVDLHADRLERAARGVAAAPARRGGDRIADRRRRARAVVRAGGPRRSRARCAGRSAPRRMRR